MLAKTSNTYRFLLSQQLRKDRHLDASRQDVHMKDNRTNFLSCSQVNAWKTYKTLMPITNVGILQTYLGEKC